VSPLDRPIPPSTSRLAQAQPTLTPEISSLHVGEGVDRQEREADEVPQAVRKPSRPGRSRGGRRPPPSATDAVPTTIRFDQEEARGIDRFVLELADRAGRRTLDKAEVFRELIRLAQEHDPTRNALVRRLK
jgi:hypothetical protein